MERCAWAGHDPLMQNYHDKYWGVPVHKDRKLFEMLILDGAQAGLSWSTILKKQSNYKKAFDNFDYEKVAKYDDKKVAALLLDAGIVRNQLKIRAAIKNAQVFNEIRKEFGSFNKYLWGFVNNTPVTNAFTTLSEIPAHTELSDKISKDLKKRGMTFVGSTIIYAFMQSVGMVNDHITSCFRYKELIKG